VVPLFATGPGRRASIAMLVVLGMLVGAFAPTVALAADEEVRLSLRPVGQAGPFFDLTMRPGETRDLVVAIGNAGRAPLIARTYAADVYTIVNGGFGGRLRDDPQSGMTAWVDYPSTLLTLPAGKITRRTFTVAVPKDTLPGEYITGLLLENDQPIRSSGALTLDEIVRQAVAVVLTVPGPREPELVIGAATHRIVAGRSIVSVAVSNPGNVRLKPYVDLALLDAGGAEASHAGLQMDSFYAHTDSFVEVPLDASLLPGRYTVRLELEDAAHDLRVAEDAIPLLVEAPPAVAVDTRDGSGLTAVLQALGGASMSIPMWAILLAATLILGGLAIGLVVVTYRRRGRRP
jgi:hypothetical protein